MSRDNSNDLLVCALEQETLGLFADRHVSYTGTGKVNAAYGLLTALNKGEPSRVINIGTAGSNIFPTGSIVCCTSFVQRDMDVTPLGFLSYQTPFSADPVILSYGEALSAYPSACCGSGDNFETAATTNVPWQVIDMEAYVLALICARQKLPFICLKYISDGADGQASENWNKTLEDGAQKLAKALEIL